MPQGGRGVGGQRRRAPANVKIRTHQDTALFLHLPKLVPGSIEVFEIKERANRYRDDAHEQLLRNHLSRFAPLLPAVSYQECKAPLAGDIERRGSRARGSTAQPRVWQR